MDTPRVDLNKYLNSAVGRAMFALSAASTEGIEKPLYELVKIRASQINGCAFCLHMHMRDARKQGVKITADMYTYPAGGTGLDASLPPWVFDGGREAAYKRLQDPATRQKIAEAVRTPTNEWENLYLLSGSPERILLASFRNDSLKPLTGKTLADCCRTHTFSACRRCNTAVFHHADKSANQP